jgi:hypothetical protein
MAKTEQIVVGNNTIEATTPDDFADGYNNGYLYYYDTNHQFRRPLTTGSIYEFMRENLFDQLASPQWNAGFVFGWIVACCENDPAFFFASIAMPESFHETGALTIAVLQET